MYVNEFVMHEFVVNVNVVGDRKLWHDMKKKGNP